jgi:DNA polymerase III alpha subunit
LDFAIEGNNIRYGLGNIKGVSDATLEKLVEFRGHNNEFENKYDLFLSAKECGINIGVLSGLIQGGLVDSFCSYADDIPNRSRLVLEAQAFNILTAREKRNIQHLGEKFDYDVLNTIHAAIKDKMIGDSKKQDSNLSRRSTTNTKKYIQKIKTI